VKTAPKMHTKHYGEHLTLLLNCVLCSTQYCAVADEALYSCYCSCTQSVISIVAKSAAINCQLVLRPAMVAHASLPQFKPYSISVTKLCCLILCLPGMPHDRHLHRVHSSPCSTYYFTLLLLLPLLQQCCQYSSSSSSSSSSIMCVVY
jgi:hypothetical protein